MGLQPKTPRHIGYILDGNRRWAKKHGLPTYEGHLAGYNALKEIIDATADAGVEYISFYTFSTENWNRAESEVRGIMKLIRRLFKSDIKELVKKGYKLVVLGGRENLPDDICKMIDDAEAASAPNSRATLAMCFNYGGQQEIVRAAYRYAQYLCKMQQGGTLLQTNDDKYDEAILAEEFAEFLDHPEVPPCDLIVRTSGEQRLSNFMLWRSAHSEFIFLEKLWPDMKREDVAAIVEEYNKRSRRYGS